MRAFYCLSFFVVLPVLFFILKREELLPFVNDLCLFLAVMVEKLLSIFSDQVQRQDNAVALSQLKAGVIVTKQCSALSYCIGALAVGLVFPQSLKNRVLFVSIFFFGIQFLNIIRLITLIFAKAWLERESFLIFHEAFWPLIFLVVSALLIIQYIGIGDRTVSNEVES